MSALVGYELHDGIACLRLNNGPQNLLSQALRQALLQQLQTCADDGQVRAVVLSANGAMFSAGLEMRELEHPEEVPTLSDLCLTVERMDKPVVAALRGVVLGGGLELALAAHARVVDPRTRIGITCLPLGLLPSAGATQRAARLLGAGRALGVLLSARGVIVGSEAARGFADEIAQDTPEAAAIAMALRLLERPEEWVRGRESEEGFADPIAYQTQIAECRARFGNKLPPVEKKLVDCVEAAILLPFEAGLAFEEAAAEECRLSEYSAGMRHAFFAQRRAANIPERQAAKAFPVNVVGIVGGGPPGAAITVTCLLHGRKVILFERNAEAVAAAKQRVDAAFGELVLSRKVSAESRVDQSNRLEFVTDLVRLAEADLLIETVSDNMKTKQQVFAALGRVARPGAVMVSNSALLSVSDIAAASERPDDVLGLHFHGPAHQAPLVQLIPSARTSAQALVTAADFSGDLGKVVVRTGTGGGTMGESLMWALREAAFGMMVQGVAPTRIDAALAEFGMVHGVFQALDRAGLDVTLSRMALLHGHNDLPGEHMALLSTLVGAGRIGQRAGHGVYRWSDAGEPHEDPVLSRFFPALAQSPLQIDDDAIVLRCIAAMANQGAKLLRAGGALRPSDIDAVMVLAHGFPRHRGGPMKSADMAGLFTVLQELKRQAPTAPDLFAPDPGFAALVRNGEAFDVLNRLGRNRRRIPG
ncbi:3-hydroxyacyl-CoA dehydrogenase NAD-binding domain-containing protein [Thalassovita taeanensis]|uniref:3-hydroxyacyl-CoA dehydrogenase n=1 Tax=Thalassovita taeanensis TaxID=657014 RepID=A0A1H9KLQ0_9RHOB|nr:3-hydroxyacyl-CoA dehydrogenase NAD-binding domain-containing protein [Thalassovita taeanensis]SER00080.1 3-hydroxyacyl-CoA dehydrogenase [Thalassovita taeanensis]